MSLLSIIWLSLKIIIGITVGVGLIKLFIILLIQLIVKFLNR